MSAPQVGDLFTLKRSMLGNPEGALGVVFYDYGDGAQLIFPNGNYDGFSAEEQQEFLTPAGHAPSVAGYQFKNVITVGQDFSRGYWRKVFNG